MVQYTHYGTVYSTHYGTVQYTHHGTVHTLWYSTKTEPKSMYQKLYERLGLDPNIDTLTIYLITQPRNVDGYTTDTFGNFRF